MVASHPEVVVIADSGFLRAIRSLNSQLPIVLPAMADPIASGITQSLARPDGNATGTAVFAIELSHKRLQLLKEAVPSLRRVGALFNAARRSNPPLGVAATVAAGKELGIEVFEMPVALPEGCEAAFGAAARQGIQGVSIVSDTATISYRSQLCDWAASYRMPTVFANRTYLRSGGFMSYGPNLEGAFHRGAYFVERILKGAKPADLPIEQATAFYLTLNMRTARAFNFSFPNSLLLRADEVIQ